MVRKRRTQHGEGLTPIMFQILVALAEGDSHGYAIMQEIERRTDCAIELGAATLYRSIKQLVEGGLIAEVKPREPVHSQRRYYRLTPNGWKVAASEARRLNAIVRWARAVDLIRPRHV